MRNNLTIYVSRGNNAQAAGLEGQLISHGNYTLLVNGDYSICQLIDAGDSIFGFMDSQLPTEPTSFITRIIETLRI